MKIPDNIQREHVLQAMEQIDREVFDGKYDSTDYDLVHNERRYPPKYVLSIANKFANDKKLELKSFRPKQAISFLNKLGFNDIQPKPVHDKEEQPKKEYEKGIDIEVVGVNFPIKDSSLEQLAQIYREIEDGNIVTPPIYVPSDCNVIPASETGNCRENVVGFIFNKRDFDTRMPEILASFIRCQHRQVLLATCYWDGSVWETTWKKPFEAVGREVYRQMYDGLPEKII